MHRIYDSVSVIVVPRTEIRSPLLGRKISTTRPYDQMVIHINHEDSSSFQFKSEYFWIDGQEIKLDLKSFVEQVEKQNDPVPDKESG